MLRYAKTFFVLFLLMSMTANSANARLFRGGGGGGGFFRRAPRRVFRQFQPPVVQQQSQPPVEEGGPSGHSTDQAQLVEGGGGPAPARRPTSINDVTTTTWQGLPKPNPGEADPRVADSVFNGKKCRSIDAPFDPNETQENIQELYRRHPALRATVKAWKDDGAIVELSTGSYKFAFKSAESTTPQSKGWDRTWEGKAEVESQIARLPMGEREKKNYEVPHFRLQKTVVNTDGGRKPIYTLTYAMEAPTTQEEIIGNDFVTLTKQRYEKVSSDGNFMRFSTFRNPAGKIAGYSIQSLCGEAYTGEGQLDLTDSNFEKASAFQALALEGLLGNKEALVEKLPMQWKELTPEVMREKGMAPLPPLENFKKVEGTSPFDKYPGLPE